MVRSPPPIYDFRRAPRIQAAPGISEPGADPPPAPRYSLHAAPHQRRWFVPARRAAAPLRNPGKRRVARIVRVAARDVRGAIRQDRAHRPRLGLSPPFLRGPSVSPPRCPPVYRAQARAAVELRRADRESRADALDRDPPVVKPVIVGAHYGLKDWLAQRLTAVAMACYTLIVLAIAGYQGGIDYALWQSLFANTAFRVATLLF